MEIKVDMAYKSLNKNEEELCGDKVEILHTDNSHILILADLDGKRRESQYPGDDDFQNPGNNVFKGHSSGGMR